MHYTTTNPIWICGRLIEVELSPIHPRGRDNDYHVGTQTQTHTQTTMSTKNIGIREEVYEHLQAHKRGDESFSDTIERLLSEVDSDWRTHFGFLDRETGEEFASVVAREREQLDADLANRQREVLDALDAEERE